MITPIIFFLVSRVAIFAFVELSLRVDPNLHNAPGEIDSGNRIVQGLTRWDGGWFFLIARDGYTQPKETNFFPLFPVMSRAISAMTGLSIAMSMLICANACSLVGLIVVYRIFSDLADETTARAALALLVAWPFSFFHAAAYPESMMMLSTAAATWLGMRRRHWLAGFALGFGVLARHLTALGGFTLIALHIEQRGIHPRRLILDRSFAALVVPVVMIAVYLGYLAWRFDDWRVWYTARDEWGRSAWWGLPALLTDQGARSPEILFYVAMSIVPGIGAIALLRRSRTRALGAFALSLMLLLWTTGIAGLGRYSAACWPAFLPIGSCLAKRPTLLVAAVIALALLQAVMLYLFVHLYPIL